MGRYLNDTRLQELWKVRGFRIAIRAVRNYVVDTQVQNRVGGRDWTYDHGRALASISRDIAEAIRAARAAQ